MTKKDKIILLILIISFFFLRLYHFRQSLNFGSDQGLELLDIYNLYKSHKITLIGPPSSFGVEGRYFFTGPALYYIFMPILVLSKWNPLTISFFLIASQFIILILLFKILKKVFQKSLTPYIFSLVYIISPTMVEYSRFFWNPNFLIPLSGLILYLLLSLKIDEKATHLKVFSIAFLLGLGLEIHYSFILAIALTLALLFLGKKLPIVNLFLLFLGFAIGFSPIIFFELRHNFYNLRTFILFITQKSYQIPTQPALNYYFFPLVPFIILGAALVLVKLKKINKTIFFITLIAYTIWSFIRILPTPKEGFTMAKGWNYQGIKKVEKLILSEKKDNYNIVDILTGDTRALALRYLLTIDRKPPMNYTDYPHADYLFIYSKVSLGQILKGSLWEIDSIKPVRLIKSWPIQNDIFLYEVTKTATPSSY